MAQTRNVGVTGPALQDIEAISRIVGAGRVVDLGTDPDPSSIAAVLGASPGQALSCFPRLEWVHIGAAGVDGWLREGRLPDGVILTSAAGNGAIPLAEHALMLMLMLSRDAVRWIRAQERHEWERHIHGELTGRTLGIIGYGNSGKNLARKALACHMRVQALRRRDAEPQDGEVTLLHGSEGLRHLLTTSDVVVVTAPLTDTTRGMIGVPELALMRPGAFLIVISRGGIVQERPLIDALRSGHLGGAGLDAHATEPLPPDSPLWDLQGVIVTPHNAATTQNTADRGREILLENVRRWCAGKELLNVVDRTNGY